MVKKLNMITFKTPIRIFLLGHMVSYVSLIWSIRLSEARSPIVITVFMSWGSAGSSNSWFTGNVNMKRQSISKPDLLLTNKLWKSTNVIIYEFNHGLKSQYRYQPMIFSINIINICRISNIGSDIDRYLVNIVSGTSKPNTISDIHIRISISNHKFNEYLRRIYIFLLERTYHVYGRTPKGQNFCRHNKNIKSN